jgi:hypothetical protein
VYINTSRDNSDNDEGESEGGDERSNWASFRWDHLFSGCGNECDSLDSTCSDGLVCSLSINSSFWLIVSIFAEEEVSSVK